MTVAILVLLAGAGLVTAAYLAANYIHPGASIPVFIIGAICVISGFNTLVENNLGRGASEARIEMATDMCHSAITDNDPDWMGMSAAGMAAAAEAATVSTETLTDDERNIAVGRCFYRMQHEATSAARG